MKTKTRMVVGALSSILLAAGVATSIDAGPRQAVPHSGGGGPRATAPRGAVPPHHGGSAARTAPVRGHPAPRGTATGHARYGYGYGYGGSAWGGYPWWGWGYGYWGAGWYGGWWGWPYYGYGYGYAYPGYGPWYVPYDDSYAVSVGEPPPSGPAVIETRVSPSKAEVVLDGESVGYASDYNGQWDRLSVKPGRHTIAFREKGYRDLVIELDAHPGATYTLNDNLTAGEGEDRRTLSAAVTPAPAEASAPMAAPPATGRLRVHVAPPDAAIYLDGEYLGLGAELARIHGALAVATGSHRIDVARPGFVSTTRNIDVGDTELATVDLTLEPEH